MFIFASIKKKPHESYLKFIPEIKKEATAYLKTIDKNRISNY
jgi:hypothetical protein